MHQQVNIAHAFQVMLFGCQTLSSILALEAH
jgi:hypothetical protein